MRRGCWGSSDANSDVDVTMSQEDDQLRCCSVSGSLEIEWQSLESSTLRQETMLIPRNEEKVHLKSQGLDLIYPGNGERLPLKSHKHQPQHLGQAPARATYVMHR